MTGIDEHWKIVQRLLAGSGCECKRCLAKK